MRIHLDLIEARLRQVIETWIVPVDQGDFLHRLAHEVVEAMQGEIFSTADGISSAPHQFKIYLHPSVVRELQGSSVLERLPEVLSMAARDAGISFTSLPELQLVPNEQFGTSEITVSIQRARTYPGNTAVLRYEPKAAELPGEPTESYSFLILGNDQTYIIRLPVINLGRRPDNQLVFDDPRVSRVHAQIRFNRGRFILFDLNSTGGTFVNGQRVRQHGLKAGDVVSLAGVTFIYGEESPRSESSGGATQVIPIPPSPPEELK